MPKFTRILSIDGGGIRGIIPGQVLVSLERKLKEHTGNPDARIADFFDLIAGTSAGGILTCIYLCPNLTSDPPRPRFSAQDAADLYAERGSEIFAVSLWQRIRSVGGLLDERYRADGLEKVLHDYFGDVRLSDLLKPCLITAYDIQQRRTTFFTQHDARKWQTHDYFLRDVARATSAAPTYFQVARVRSQTRVYYPLIDGGVFANNPALCAYAEVRKKFPHGSTAKDMVILSLGTGNISQPYSYESAKGWGLIEWIRPLINIMSSGVSETVAYQLEQIFDAVQRPGQYVRIDSPLHFSSSYVDDASRENILSLQQEGTRIARDFDKHLDSFVELLVQ